jgi:hypothetical protein
LTSQSDFAILLTRITNEIVDYLFTTKKLGTSSTKREYIMRWYESPGFHISVDEGGPGFSLDRGRKCITRTSTSSVVVRTTMRDEIFSRVSHPFLGDDSGLMKKNHPLYRLSSSFYFLNELLTSLNHLMDHELPQFRSDYAY